MGLSIIIGPIVLDWQLLLSQKTLTSSFGKTSAECGNKSEGKFDFVRKSDNFALIFQFCAIWFKICLKSWFMLIIFLNALFIFWFMLIFLSMTIVCYSENFAFIFKSCAIYFYLCLKKKNSWLLFFLSVTAIFQAGIWSDRCARVGKERPRGRAAVCFRSIIFEFATSRIHKQHVQLGHADGCRSNKHRKQKLFACLSLMCISHMKSILGGTWFLGAQGSRLPLPNG